MSQEERERIDRYLAGRLSDEERGSVEERIIREPAYRAEVELTAALRDGLEELAAQGELECVLGGSTAFWQRPAYALAASVLAALAGITALALYQQLDQARGRIGMLAREITTTQLAAGDRTQVLRLVRTRSATDQSDLSWQADPDTGQIELRLDAGVEPAGSYALRIDRGGGEASVTLLALPSLTPVDGELALTVNAALLQPGDYAVTIEPAGGGEATVLRLRIE